MLPETRYARSGDVSIAFQTLGDGPLDLVFVPGFVSHVEHWWEDPSSARSLQRLASFSRLILFDKRGTGLSDPVLGVPTTGIALIVGILAQARKARQGISASGLSDHYREIFQITRLVDFMSIFPDEKTALAEKPAPTT